MSISGIQLADFSVSCRYITGKQFSGEHYIIHSLNSEEMDFFLRYGYRHFGFYFFRPLCEGCHQCIPLRIPLNTFRFSRSERRVFSKNKGFRTEVGPPFPSRDAFRLYKTHKKRFEEQGRESYEQFAESFFAPLACSYQLSLYDGEELIAVSHFDATEHSLSAVYCYYHDGYHRHSLGAYAILKEIELAIEWGLDFVYLGYFVPENNHMNYKIRYCPNQLFIGEGSWVDYMDADRHILFPHATSIGFSPQTRLIQYSA